MRKRSTLGWKRWHFFTETFGIKVRLRNLNRTVLRLVRHISTALFLGMVLYYPAPSPIIMVPVQQCKMAVVISKVKILLEIDPFFAEAWIMASRLDDHSRSCFWHPVRAGRPTALWGQTMTFKMLTPVTPGWASSRVRDRSLTNYNNLDGSGFQVWAAFCNLPH